MAANILFFCKKKTLNFYLFFGNFCRQKYIFLCFFSISISPNLCSNLKTWWSLTYRVPTLICVGKHNICVGNCEIILIGNREIKRPRICHDFKTANFNSREFKWGYSIVCWWLLGWREEGYWGKVHILGVNGTRIKEGGWPSSLSWLNVFNGNIIYIKLKKIYKFSTK